MNKELYQYFTSSDDEIKVIFAVNGSERLAIHTFLRENKPFIYSRSIFSTRFPGYIKQVLYKCDKCDKKVVLKWSKKYEDSFEYRCKNNKCDNSSLSETLSRERSKEIFHSNSYTKLYENNCVVVGKYIKHIYCPHIVSDCVNEEELLSFIENTNIVRITCPQNKRTTIETFKQYIDSSKVLH